MFCFVLLILLPFCSKEPSLTVGEVTYRLFDRVVVKINVDKSSTENKFLSFSIISKKVLHFKKPPFTAQLKEVAQLIRGVTEFIII